MVRVTSITEICYTSFFAPQKLFVYTLLCAYNSSWNLESIWWHNLIRPLNARYAFNPIFVHYFYNSFCSFPCRSSKRSTVLPASDGGKPYYIPAGVEWAKCYHARNFYRRLSLLAYRTQSGWCTGVKTSGVLMVCVIASRSLIYWIKISAWEFDPSRFLDSRLSKVYQNYWVSE